MIGGLDACHFLRSNPLADQPEYERGYYSLDSRPSLVVFDDFSGARRKYFLCLDL